MSKVPSRLFSQVQTTTYDGYTSIHILIWHPSDIYRIVSAKSLEQSSDPIKPPTGDSITVQPSVDTSAAQKGGCC